MLLYGPKIRNKDLVFLVLCGFYSERLSLPLGARDGLRLIIVALPGALSILSFCIYVLNEK